MNLKRYGLPILLVILILGAALRLWGITSESYWLDETISIRQAQGDLGASIELVKQDVHLPLYVIVLNLWVRLFGISELSSRLLSLLFGVLAVGVMYLLAGKLFSQEIAVVSALLMCVSPIMIYYSQEARLYSLFVLLTLLSFNFFIRYLESRDYRHLSAYVLFSLPLMYTHIFSFLIFLVQHAYVLYVNGLRFRHMRDWYISQFALIVLFIPWLPNLLAQITGSAYSLLWIPPLTLRILSFTLYDFFGNYLSLGLFTLLFIAFVWARKFKLVDMASLALPVLWIVLPFLLVIAYSLAFSPLYLTRYMLFTWPALFLIFAALLGKIMQKKRRLAWIIVGLLAISSLLSVAEQARRIDKPDWKAVALFMRQNAGEADIIFIDPFYQQEPFAYYYDRDCFSAKDTYSCNYERHKVVSLDWKAECCSDATLLLVSGGNATLGEYQHMPLWLISLRPELYDGNTTLFSYFNSRKKMLGSYAIGDIDIYKFG